MQCETPTDISASAKCARCERVLSGNNGVLSKKSKTGFYQLCISCKQYNSSLTHSCICTGCGIEKDINNENFRLHGARSAINSARCRKCLSEDNKQVYKNRQIRFKLAAPQRPDTKVCYKCKVVFPGTEFRRSYCGADGFSPCCKGCRLLANQIKLKRERSRDPELYSAQAMCAAAKLRAKKAGIPFALTPAYIRTLCVASCPVLGVLLDYKGLRIGDNSASLDKFHPELGYVPGNVAVISKLANMIKASATTTQVGRVYKWMQETEPKMLKRKFQ